MSVLVRRVIRWLGIALGLILGGWLLGRRQRPSLVPSPKAAEAEELRQEAEALRSPPLPTDQAKIDSDLRRFKLIRGGKS